MDMDINMDTVSRFVSMFEDWVGVEPTLFQYFHSVINSHQLNQISYQSLLKDLFNLINNTFLKSRWVYQDSNLDYVSISHVC